MPQKLLELARSAAVTGLPCERSGGSAVRNLLVNFEPLLEFESQTTQNHEDCRGFGCQHVVPQSQGIGRLSGGGGIHGGENLLFSREPDQVGNVLWRDIPTLPDVQRELFCLAAQESGVVADKVDEALRGTRLKPLSAVACLADHEVEQGGTPQALALADATHACSDLEKARRLGKSAALEHQRTRWGGAFEISFECAPVHSHEGICFADHDNPPIRQKRKRGEIFEHRVYRRWS